MPTYEYECISHGVFEEFHSITTKLEFCPQCKESGKEQSIVRLISLGSKGIVELYGNELISKLKEDGKQLQRDAAKSDKLYSNLLGEDKFESLTKRIDQQNKIRRSK
jgi:putative FmdB family regulatory protein